MWNPYCRQNVNAGPLEELIERYELVVINDTDFPTRPSSPGMSIIDLALTSPELGSLQVWKTPEEYPLLSNHELILMEWEDIKIPGQKNTQAAISGWSIKNLLEDEKKLKAVRSDWEKVNADHQLLVLLCTKQELDKKVEWFQETLTEFLNNHTKITQITSYSKRW